MTANLRHRVKEGWESVLHRILESARAQGAAGVLAFDLDSTLFDNRPRQARILREFGEAQKIPALIACRPDHWTSGWDMLGAMTACGLAAEEANGLLVPARRFWQTRFFTSEYCRDDVAIDGAAEFVRAAWEAGGTIAYVTGRHEPMREGTIDAMRRCGLVTPGERVELIMKPTYDLSDDQFKRDAHARIDRIGTMIAAFDNEPTHVNDYRLRFPEATIVHLATDHSGRPVELLDGVISVPNFVLAKVAGEERPRDN